MLKKKVPTKQNSDYVNKYNKTVILCLLIVKWILWIYLKAQNMKWSDDIYAMTMQLYPQLLSNSPTVNMTSEVRLCSDLNI